MYTVLTFVFVAQRLEPELLQEVCTAIWTNLYILFQLTLSTTWVGRRTLSKTRVLPIFVNIVYDCLSILTWLETSWHRIGTHNTRLFEWPRKSCLFGTLTQVPGPRGPRRRSVVFSVWDVLFKTKCVRSHLTFRLTVQPLGILVPRPEIRLQEPFGVSRDYSSLGHPY